MGEDKQIVLPEYVQFAKGPQQIMVGPGVFGIVVRLSGEGNREKPVDMIYIFAIIDPGLMKDYESVDAIAAVIDR